jgi:hypothetical protein
LSVRREAFAATGGFTEQQPIAYAHEELAWQAELAKRGVRILFEPGAVAWHRNRPGLGNLLRRNYRWGYSAIVEKARSPVVRAAWAYRYPRLLMLLSLPLAVLSTGYILACWVRARLFEPLWFAPVILAARLSYAAGMIAGGVRLLDRDAAPELRPRWE